MRFTDVICALSAANYVPSVQHVGTIPSIACTLANESLQQPALLHAWESKGALSNRFNAFYCFNESYTVRTTPFYVTAAVDKRIVIKRSDTPCDISVSYAVTTAP